ncbi:MAG: SurA N-terminal domain-containing protein [Thermodesulfobacteriota bacterium]|nr:SurA N-terminal domain-containing protein [Thermodesulfobacteriota bacterium]
MLQLMRKKASSVLIKGILSIIVLAFIFMGVGNFRERRMTKAAVVNGKIITARQFQNRYYQLRENYRRQFGGQLNDELLKMLNLKEQAMDQLIAEALLLQKADEMGLRVSDRELAAAIKQMDVFQRNGVFDKAFYNAQLQRNRLTPENFETLTRRDMLTSKLRSLIMDRVKVSEKEARTWYNWENAEVSVSAAIFRPEQYTDVEPTATELQAYFDANKEKYKTRAKAKVTYVGFHPSDFTDQVTIPDDEITDYYDTHKADYTNDKKVEARHILIKVDEGADEAVVAEKQQKAMEIYDQIQKGRDFAEAAKEFSEGPSAKKGGYLGEFTQDAMVAPFSDKAFAMAAGEVSQPVRTRFGWHLIKVEKVIPPSVTPLAQVKPDIEKTLTENKAKEKAYGAALDFFDAALNKDSVKDAAAAKGLVPMTTGLFTEDASKIKGIPQARMFARQVFDLFEGEISDVINLDDAYYLFQVDERVPAQVPPFDEVQHAVKEDVKEQLQQEEAESMANKILEKVKNGQSLADACKDAGVTPVTTAFFGRNGSIPDIGREPEVTQEAFLLSENKPLAPNIIKGQKGYFIIRLEEKRYPEDAGIEEKKDAAMDRLLRQKQGDLYSSWIAAMRSTGDVDVEERFLE